MMSSLLEALSLILFFGFTSIADLNKTVAMKEMEYLQSSTQAA